MSFSTNNTYKFLNLRHLYHSSPLQLYLLPSPWLLHFFYLVGVAEVFCFGDVLRSDYFCRFCLILHFHEYLFLKCLFIWWCSQFILMFKIRIRTSSVNVHTKKWYSGIKIVPWTLHIPMQSAHDLAKIMRFVLRHIQFVSPTRVGSGIWIIFWVGTEKTAEARAK